jgi:hypothetical protein
MAPEKNEEEPTVERTYKKKVYPGREDGDPVTRSKIHPIEKLIKVGEAAAVCNHTEKKINYFRAIKESIPNIQNFI